MPTTTNYGWTTPADTDLVKDGAAAIRTLGSSIDSTLKTQIDAQIPDSLLTTKGDIIAATGASTPARLAVGTNDQVLIADSTAATGLKWGTPASGGYTLLSTTTLSGSATNITGISQSYTDLLIVLNGVTTATTAGTLTFKFRDSSAADITATTMIDGIQSDGGGARALYTAAYFSNLVTTTTLKTATADNAFCFRISDYSESVYGRQIIYSGRYTSGATTNRNETATGSLGTAAVSGLNLALSAGTFSAGTCKIWGLK
jgi:hypothetical protein